MDVCLGKRVAGAVAVLGLTLSGVVAEKRVAAQTLGVRATSPIFAEESFTPERRASLEGTLA